MHYIIIFCTFAAPNAGLMCVDSKPIATLQECELVRDAINLNGIKRCVRGD